MGWSLTLGRIAGIRVRIHLTFVLFLAWIGLAFWQSGGAHAAIIGLSYIVLLFACVVAHEFGHILVARRYGAETLDVILLPIGGLARMKSIPERPAEELVVALAGPAVNLAIAGVLIALLGPEVFRQALTMPTTALGLLPRLAAANVVLAVFNLLPAFPMDGGRALRALLAMRWGRLRATDLASRIGHALAVGLGVFGLLAGYPLLMLIAVFIFMGASAENGEARLHAFARNMRVTDAMITRFSSLPIGATLGEAVQLLVHSTQHDVPLVDGFGKPIGLATRDAILRVLHDCGAGRPLADAMRQDVCIVGEDEALDPALATMQQRGLPALLATDRQGRLTGMLTLENLGQLMLVTRLSVPSGGV